MIGWHTDSFCRTNQLFVGTDAPLVCTDESIGIRINNAEVPTCYIFVWEKYADVRTNDPEQKTNSISVHISNSFLNTIRSYLHTNQ